MTLSIVTGGLGFIGSHVADLLIENGHEVVVLDNLKTGRKDNINPNVKEYIHQSFQEIESAFWHDADYIFHLAALPRIQPSFDDPIGHEKENVEYTIDLMTKLKDSSKLKKLVFSSSSAVYGTPTEFPTTENAAISPLSPYALQKYTAEQYVLILGQRYGIPANCLRYFNVYGPRSFNPADPFNAYSSVIGIFQSQLAQGKPLTVTGSGSQERDFIHVKDVAQANYLAAIKDITYEIFNIGYGEKISILDLAKTMSDDVQLIDERAGESEITWADISKAKKLMGWSPKISLKEGLKS